MKAVLCKSYGPPENLVLEEVEPPKPKDDEVRVEVFAAALNFPDTLQIQGQYQYQPPFPFTPGSEVSGKVAEVGKKVKGLKPGDRVMAMTGIGGLAEEMVANGFAVSRIPDDMDMATASGFGMVYGTSYYALKQRAELQSGENLLVLGASGGVGLSAVEIGKTMGARVIAAASTDEKLEVAKKSGADELINYSDGQLKDRVKELTAGNGADVIYDPVGGDAFDQATRCINWNGRLLVIGFTSGRIPQYPANLALLKGCSLVGVYWGRFARTETRVYLQNLAELFELYEERKIKPLVSRVFPLEKYADALNLFVERKAVGKVILTVRQE